MMTFKQYKKTLNDLNEKFETASYDDIRTAMKKLEDFENSHPIYSFFDILFEK